MDITDLLAASGGIHMVTMLIHIDMDLVSDVDITDIVKYLYK